MLLKHPTVQPIQSSASFTSQGKQAVTIATTTVADTKSVFQFKTVSVSTSSSDVETRHDRMTVEFRLGYYVLTLTRICTELFVVIIKKKKLQ